MFQHSDSSHPRVCLRQLTAHVRLKVHTRLQSSAARDWAADEGGRQIGTVTSTATGLDGQPVAMGYLRCRAKGAQVPPAL